MNIVAIKMILSRIPIGHLLEIHTEIKKIEKTDSHQIKNNQSTSTTAASAVPYTSSTPKENRVEAVPFSLTAIPVLGAAMPADMQCNDQMIQSQFRGMNLPDLLNHNRTLHDYSINDNLYVSTQCPQGISSFCVSHTLY